MLANKIKKFVQIYINILVTFELLVIHSWIIINKFIGIIYLKIRFSVFIHNLNLIHRYFKYFIHCNMI